MPLFSPRLVPRIALGLWLCVALGACHGHPAPQEAAHPKPPGVELDGADLTETAEGARVWDLHAARVDYRQEAQTASLTRVTTRFWQAGQIVSRGQAPQASFDLRTRILTLRGGVELVAADQKTGFAAQSATWWPKPGELKADGPVRFWRGVNQLQAGHLIADRAIQRVALDGAVTGLVAMAPSGTRGALLPSTLLHLPGPTRP